MVGLLLNKRWLNEGWAWIALDVGVDFFSFDLSPFLARSKISFLVSTNLERFIIHDTPQYFYNCMYHMISEVHLSRESITMYSSTYRKRLTGSRFRREWNFMTKQDCCFFVSIARESTPKSSLRIPSVCACRRGMERCVVLVQGPTDTPLRIPY